MQAEVSKGFTSMRVFMAIDFEKNVLNEYLEVLKRLNVRMLRLQQPEQIHMTLRFIGEVDEAVIPQYQALMDERCGKIARFDLVFDQWLTLPPRGPCRIAGLKASQTPRSLSELFTQLDLGCGGLGSPGEKRAFLPHVTLGRIKDDTSKGGFRRALVTLPPPKLQVQVGEIRLYRSRLSQVGASYELLHTSYLSSN